MDDDFDIPAGDDMMMGDGLGDFGGDDGPGMKVGEEKEIGKQGLKKKLLKEGEGWDTPEVGDEVEGIRTTTATVFLPNRRWHVAVLSSPCPALGFRCSVVRCGASGQIRRNL